MFGKRKTQPVVVQRYDSKGRKEVVALDSPKDARKFINKIAKEHKYVRDTPNGLTVTDADGKPIVHYNIEKEK